MIIPYGFEVIMPRQFNIIKTENCQKFLRDDIFYKKIKTYCTLLYYKH